MNDRTYPYKDEYCTVWVDPDGFLGRSEEPCFICKIPTLRIDINFDGHYCGSPECDESIRKDLESYG